MKAASTKMNLSQNDLLLSFQDSLPPTDSLNISEIRENQSSLPSLSFSSNFSSFNSQLTAESLEQLIINTIKQEDSMSLLSKLQFTYFISQHANLLSHLSEFYEEECHLSLLNWVWKEKKLLKNPYSSLSDMNSLCGLLELLYNILFIFENLPIKSNDILDLRLFEKLNKIKVYINRWNVFLPVLGKISAVLDKWKKEVDEDTEVKLGQKRKRNNEEETEAESEDNTPVVNLLVYNIAQTKNKKEKKHVKIDLIKNKTVYFDKEQEPLAVGIVKKEYDPLMLI